MPLTTIEHNKIQGDAIGSCLKQRFSVKSALAYSYRDIRFFGQFIGLIF